MRYPSDECPHVTTAPLQFQSLATFALEALDTPVVRGGVLILARLVPIAALSPLMGGTMAPARFRFGVSVLLAAAFAPIFPVEKSPGQSMALMLVVQGLIGLSMALAIRFIFEIYAAAGKLIDEARGAGNAELFDPFNNQQQQSQLGAFLNVAAMAIFAASGGHGAFLTAFAEGLVLVPAASTDLVSVLGERSTVWFISLAGALLVTALKLAMPVLAVALLIDLALGLVNKVAPQIQAGNLGLIMKGAAAAAVLSFSLALGFTEPVRAVVSAMSSWLRSIV
ncbi:MAG: hypothetical protein AMXMBFR58_30250 [Phycisphaerae bacterium]